VESNPKRTTLTRMRNVECTFTMKHFYEYLLGAITIFWVFLMSSILVTNYFLFYNSIDFGNYVQALWSSVHGMSLLMSSHFFDNVAYPNVIVPSSFLENHFMPALFIATPFYALFPTPVTLSIFQSCLVATGVIPVYLLAKKLTTPFEGFVFGIAYLCNPSLIFSVLNDFHAEVFLIPLLMFTFYFGYFQKWKSFILFSLLSCTVIEVAPFLVGSIVLYLFWTKKIRLYRFLSAGFLLAVYYIFAMSARYALGFSPTYGEAPSFLSYYSVLGITQDSVFNVFTTAILHPARILPALTYQWYGKVFLLLFLFGNTLFLSLYHWKSVVLIAPWLSLALLSNFVSYYSPYFQYAGFVLFGITPLAILGYKQIRSKHTPKMFMYLILFMILFVSLTGCMIALFQTNLVTGYLPPFSYPPYQANQNLINLIPVGASVVSSPPYFTHVANRMDAWQLSVPDANATLQISQATVFLQHVTPQYVLLSENLSSDYNSYWIYTHLVETKNYVLVANTTLLALWKS